MTLLKLFISFVQVGLFSVGGGYAAIALIREQVVEINSWLTMSQFSDLTAIAEMTPGPVAINAATFTGIRIAGFPGAFAATLGCITPSIIISTILAFVYYKYKGAKTLQSVLGSIRPVTIGIIFSAGLSILQYAIFTDGAVSFSSVDYVSAFVFVLSFILLRKTKLSPVPVMLISGVIYLLISLILPSAV